MSSPSIGSVDLSTSPLSASSSASARKRLTTGTPVYSPNETLNQMTQEAEARQQDKYTAQKEIRAIRAKEMEKQRKEDEERERVSNNYSNGQVSSSSTSVSSANKPRLYSTSSVTSRFDETNPSEDNPRELKKKLVEMDEKFKKHAMFQTQLENDNQKLIYEVDLLKDLIEEHQELIVELRRQFKEKSKELDYQKRANKDLQTDFIRLKEILKQRDALIEESGLRLYTDYEVKKANAFTSSNSKPNSNSTNSDNEKVNEIKSVLPAVLLAPDTAKLLDLLGEGTIDDKLRKLFNEKQELKEHNTKLLSELEEERQKAVEFEKKFIASANKLVNNQESSQELHEIQRQYTKEINELKMKLQKLEHENIIIKQDKQRLDTQLKYLQTNFDELENTERRLIKEKRDAQRELNESKMLVNDLQLKLEVLQKTLEKKRQATKYIDTNTYNSLCSSSSTSLISTPTQLNSNQLLLTSSSSTVLLNNNSNTNGSNNNHISNSTSHDQPKIGNLVIEKQDRISNSSQQTPMTSNTISECSSSPSSGSSSSSASPSSHQNQTSNTERRNSNEESQPTTPKAVKLLHKISDETEQDVFIEATRLDKNTSRELP